MRKSQLTLFAIIGLVLVLSAALVMYSLYRSPIKVEDVEYAVQEIPTHASPVQIYVQDCIHKIALDGIIRLGERGGYIEPYNPELSRRLIATDPLGKNPTQYDAFSIASGRPYSNIVTGEDSIPYWWHMRDYDKAPYQDGCSLCFATDELIPSLDDISMQLKEYIEREFSGCIDDFRAFEREGMIIHNISSAAATVFITEHDIRVNVNYPIEISKRESVVSIEDFELAIPIEFKRIHRLAAAIAQMQANTSYFEYVMMNTIGSYSGIDASKLPPTADFEEGSRIVKWKISDVEKQLKDLLIMNINTISIANTKDARKIAIPGAGQSSQDIYDLLLWNINVSEPEIYASVQYLGWPMYLDITPNSQGSIEPSVYKQDASPFNIVPASQSNTYEFFYDLSIPILIVLTDPQALWNTGYTFQFAIEANIRDNLNLIQWNRGEGTMGPWDFGGTVASQTMTDVDPGNCTYSDEGIWACDATGQEYLDETECSSRCFTSASSAEPLNLTTSFFCDSAQRISGPIVIKSVDKKTGGPLGGVAISFGCGEHLTCPLGETEHNSVTGESALVTHLPVCEGGGFFRFTKERYANSNRFDYSSRVGIPDFFTIEMEPLRQKKVTMKRLDVGDRAESRKYLYRVVSKILFATDMRLLELVNALPCLKDTDVIYRNLISDPDANPLHQYTYVSELGLPVAEIDRTLSRSYYKGYYKDCLESKEICDISLLNNPAFNSSVNLVLNETGLNVSGNGSYAFIHSDAVLHKLDSCQMIGKILGIQTGLQAGRFGTWIARYAPCRTARIITEGYYLGLIKMNNDIETSTLAQHLALDMESMFRIAYDIENITKVYDSEESASYFTVNYSLNQNGSVFNDIFAMAKHTGGPYFILPDNYSVTYKEGYERIIPDGYTAVISPLEESGIQIAATQIRRYMVDNSILLVGRLGQAEYDRIIEKIDMILNQLSTVPDMTPTAPDSLNGNDSIAHFHDNAYPHLEQQDYSIILERQVESAYDEDIQFSAYVTDPAAENYIDMIPGRYKVTVNFLNQTGKIIPANSSYMPLYSPECCNNISYGKHARLLSVLGCNDQGSQQYPDSDQPLIPLMAGGVMMDNVTGYWNVTEEMLNQDNEIIMFVLQTPDIDNLENLDNFAKIESLSVTYRKYTQPVIKSD